MKTTGAVILLLLSNVAWTANADESTNIGLEIFFIDVEGGAATLVVSNAGQSLLIDTGNPGERDGGRIVRVARDVAGLKKIDHLVTTHWHLDHYGGVGKVAEKLPIEHFFDRGIPDSLPEDKANFPFLIAKYRSLSKGKRTEIKPGDTFQLATKSGPAVKALCLTSAGRVLPAKANVDNECCGKAERQPEDTSDNAKSVSLVLSLGPWRFLDCGDLTWNVEEKLVCPRDAIGKIDVFQVTHHGLDVSNNPVLVNTIKPTVAVFNNGPRKGAAVNVTRTLRNLAEVKAIYQLHRNEGVDASLNTEPALIANGSSDCKGEFVRLTVAEDGKSYRLRIGEKGEARTFQTRM